MKTLLVVVFCSLTIDAIAQSRGGTGNTGATKPFNPSTPGLASNSNIPMQDVDRPVFVSGKVILADGSPVSESVGIESVCSNRKRIEAYTDSHGNFSFELKKKSGATGGQWADISSAGDDTFSHGNDPFQYQNCELQAVLPGFASDTVDLAAHMSSTIGSTDVGRIVIRPMGQAQASILSATSLAAPNSAKKAMDKAREEVKKNKIPEAEKSLEKAVQIYPQYAAAWTELGQLQYMTHDTAGAQHSFEQAAAADPKYAKPYVGLAELAVESSNWQKAVGLTNKLLDMNPSYPAGWLLHGIAQYNLKDYEGAETSARSGLKVDPDHRVPWLEHLLGLMMAGKHDYVQAAEHMRAFVRYSTQPAELAEGQKLLAEIERRSAQAKLATAPQN